MYKQFTKSNTQKIKNKSLKNGISEVDYEGLWRKTYRTAINQGGGQPSTQGREEKRLSLLLFFLQLTALSFGSLYMGIDSSTLSGAVSINGGLFLLVAVLAFSNIFLTINVFNPEIKIFFRKAIFFLLVIFRYGFIII